MLPPGHPGHRHLRRRQITRPAGAKVTLSLTIQPENSIFRQVYIVVKFENPLILER